MKPDAMWLHSPPIIPKKLHGVGYKNNIHDSEILASPSYWIHGITSLPSVSSMDRMGVKLVSPTGQDANVGKAK